MNTISGEKLVNLIGFSVYHPGFRNILKELKEEIPVAVRVNVDHLRIDKISKNELGVVMDFTTPMGILNHTGIKPQLFTTEKFELILSEVRFSNYGQHVVSFPFGLSPGDSDIEVIRHLGKKPTKKYKLKGGTDRVGYMYYYYTEKFHIIIYIDNDKKLYELIVQFLRSIDKKYLVNKPSATIQNESINEEKLDKIQKLKESLPVNQWRKRMTRGDNSFTEKNLLVSENTLVLFIDHICVAASEKKSAKVVQAIKKVVQAFNKLNKSNGFFIETMEREELASFITKVAKLTGFLVQKDEDITEEWREW